MLSGFVLTQNTLLSHTTLRLIIGKDHKDNKGLPHNTTVLPAFELEIIG